MAIFNSYVKLPEGKSHSIPLNHQKSELNHHLILLKMEGIKLPEGISQPPMFGPRQLSRLAGAEKPRWLPVELRSCAPPRACCPRNRCLPRPSATHRCTRPWKEKNPPSWAMCIISWHFPPNFCHVCIGKRIEIFDQYWI